MCDVLSEEKKQVAFHKSEELREINWPEKETFLFAEILADFRGEFHDIREDFSFAKCLNPTSYAASQKLAEELLDKGSAGIIYPSVRHSGGNLHRMFPSGLGEQRPKKWSDICGV